MIVLVPRDPSNEEYVVCPRALITIGELRDRMLRRAKVEPGSYAYSLVEDLHASIFLQSLDLKADYETYFAREYGSFDEYLRRRRRLPSTVVPAITSAIEASSGIFHFKPGYGYLADTYGIEILTQLIEDSAEGEVL